MPRAKYLLERPCRSFPMVGGDGSGARRNGAHPGRHVIMCSVGLARYFPGRLGRPCSGVAGGAETAPGENPKKFGAGEAFWTRGIHSGILAPEVLSSSVPGTNFPLVGRLRRGPTAPSLPSRLSEDRFVPLAPGNLRMLFYPLAHNRGCYHIDDEYSFSDVDMPLDKSEGRADREGGPSIRALATVVRKERLDQSEQQYTFPTVVCL